MATEILCMKTIRQKPIEKVWCDFQSELGLSDEQVEQFKTYADLLMMRNQEINLTAIQDLSGIVRQHFMDSIVLREAVDLTKIQSICDVGTGAGFPGLPLKILFPHLRLILIEVTKKKQQFLEEIVRILGLEDVEICDLDWRTFLRTTQYKVDLFISRAALDEVELSRAFRSSCFFRNITVVYWVTDQWEADPKVAKHCKRLFTYKLGRKTRKLAFLNA